MKNKTIQTQVIAGKYKGLKLNLPDLSTTRSTKSILKESVFNTLSFDIVDKIFIEVFGGSGSMAIEALSRGAKEAYAIELDRKAFQVLLSNKKLLHVQNLICKNADTFMETPEIVQNLSKSAYLYFDPPFSYRENMDDIYEKSFTLFQNLPPQKVTLGIFEHMSSLKTPETLGNFHKIKMKKFGKSSLSYYTP